MFKEAPGRFGPPGSRPNGLQRAFSASLSTLSTLSTTLGPSWHCLASALPQPKALYMNGLCASANRGVVEFARSVIRAGSGKVTKTLDINVGFR